MSLVCVKKIFPTSPPFHISYIAPGEESLIASLSGKLDDYTFQPSKSGTTIVAKAKESYQDRYHASTRAEQKWEERLSIVEAKFRLVEAKFRQSEDALRLSEGILRRSQIYTHLLSIIQPHLFDALPNYTQNILIQHGLADLPQTFVIWWTYWNQCDQDLFPIPKSMSNYTIPPKLRSFFRLLVDHDGRESRVGVVVREAWERDDVSSDLMVHCWCSKKSNNAVRNIITHPASSRKQAEELLTQDLSENVQLRDCAISYISNAPEIFSSP